MLECTVDFWESDFQQKQSGRELPAELKDENILGDLVSVLTSV
jgi:hypothetical protein